jgi:hypothetical protein
MPWASSFRGPVVVAFLIAPPALACNLLLAFGVAREAVVPTVALAFVPAATFVFGALTAAHRHVLVFAGLALNMTAEPLNRAIIGPLYVADVLVLLAVGSWAASGLLQIRAGARPHWPQTPVLSWPLVLFAVPLIWAALKGHEAYGETPFGAPFRFVAYSLIACAIAGMTARQAYKGIVAVFYLGTIWMFIDAVRHLAAGTAQTDNFVLSTGGTRVVSLAVSLYLALAFFLALINLQVDRSLIRRFGHVAIGSLAAFGTVLAYGRAVYVAVAILLPIVLITMAKVRGALASVAPFLLPFVVAGIVFVPRAAPDLVPTFLDRITQTNEDDHNVRFRNAANDASLDLVRESPVTGVGFGRDIHFTLDERRYELEQGSHNSYLWMLSGGGALALGGLALLLVCFAFDAFRRLRSATDRLEGALITWAMVALAVVLINAATSPVLTPPSTLITIWILLLLPTVVPRRPAREPAAAPATAVA